MKIKILVLAGLSCVAVQVAKGQSKFEINQQYVEKSLKALSDDDLNGRKVFSEGIEKAAGMIENSFKETGLSFMPGLKSFRQEFSIYDQSIASIKVAHEGEEIDTTDIFGMYNNEKINWSSTSGVLIHRIEADKKFNQEFSNLRAADKDMLVLVDSAHKKIFNRYQQYFSRGGIKTEKNKGNSLVFILVDDLTKENYTVDIQTIYDEKKLANVAGVIEGVKKDEIVLFSGHYDHIGILDPVEGDSIANGANDDASGTVAVMSLAKYFKGQGKPQRTIYFVAFTAEEVGGYGSQHFSRQLNPDKIVAMFNIEMIGKPAVEGPNTAWITGFDRSDFGEILQNSVEGTAYKFYADPYPDQNLFYRSDNATLARLGVPAHSISTTPIDVDKDYHQVSDEYETIDTEHMTNTIKAIAAAAKTIVSGKATPSRVDVSKVD